VRWLRRIGGADDPGAGLRRRPPTDDEMRGDRRNADRLLGLAFNKIRATPARRRHRLLTRNDRDKTRKRGCVNCWIRQRTALINARRGLMAEFGIIAAARPRHVGELIALLSAANGKRIPAPLHSALVPMGEALASLARQDRYCRQADPRLGARQSELPPPDHHSRLRTDPRPAPGQALARAMAAIVVEPNAFNSGRHFAASLGLVPRQDGTGGKGRLGPISKRGNGYLRRLWVSGAMAGLGSKRAGGDACSSNCRPRRSACSSPVRSPTKPAPAQAGDGAPRRGGDDAAAELPPDAGGGVGTRHRQRPESCQGERG